MAIGFHNEVQQVNAERVPAKPERGVMIPQRASDFQRYFPGDPLPDVVRAVIRAAASGEPAAQNELFDKMLESDLHLRSESKKRCMAVTGLEWDIESASITREADLSDSEAKLADEIASHVRHRMRRIAGLRSGFVHLIDAIGRGLSVCEIEWQHDDGEFVPHRLHCVSPFRLRHDYMEPWRLRIQRDDTDSEGVAVDETKPGKFIVHAPNPIGGFAIRGGLYRATLPWWMFKHFGIQFFIKALELFGQPFRTATYQKDATKEVKDEMLRMLEYMGISAGGIFPEGSNFNIHESKMTSSGEWPQERLVRIANAEISKGFIGATLMTEVGSSGGNRALGEVQNEVREDIRDDDIAAESETITEQLIRPIVANSVFANRGGLELLPCFKRVVPEPVDDKADAELLSKAINDWGMTVPVRYANERFGIPVVDDADLDQPLPGRSSSQSFDVLSELTPNSERHDSDLRVTAHRALETITKRRRSSASKLASWIFAAIAVSAAHTENVVASVGEFVSRRRDLPTALEDLPDAFDRLPTDEMTAVQTEYLLAARMAGMLEARSKLSRRVANSERLIANAEISFEAIPFVQAIEALRERLGLNPVEFELLEAEARSRAFRVAAVWDMRLLSDIHRELAASIEAGETTREFRLRLPAMTDRNGWTGENPWHADVVHFQNFAMAHGAGRYQEYGEFGIERWRFVANGDSCPICSPVIGRIFRMSDRKFFPPLHFWCDCEDEPVFEDEDGDAFIDSARIENKPFETQRERAGGFGWDPAQYANLEPVSMATIVPALQPRFEAFAKQQNWEIAE